MRLKRLELLGFKSFADTTVFEFGNDTLTGIVGPNGCGKSNVVDAIRWILGEQRPTSMRGKEMIDVIFKGCASRPSMGVAEGTIVLDNSAGTIETHGAEISVTRRVFKSGEGEYQIDGSKVRLKDVKEMLFDTGLGSRGYSVLEQGRIDAVLSANAVDRRRIFEEAAGISRYRQRKHETELRLARVQQDLARLDDVTGELRSRVRSLKIQAGKAERYLEARVEWEGLKTRLVKHQLHSFGIEFETCLAEIEAIELSLGEKRGEREALEESIATLEQERATVVDELHDVTEDVSRLEGDVRALDERRTQLLARVQSWEHIAGEEAQRVDELTAQLALRSEELAVLEQQKAALESEVVSVRTEAERRQAERQQWSQVYDEFRQRSEQQNELLLKALNERTAAENTVRHLDEAQAPAAERTERVEARLREASEQLQSFEGEEERAALELSESQESLTQAEAAQLEAQSEVKRSAAHLEEREAESNRLELELTRRNSHIESLLDREREMADLGEGARAVLDAIEAQEGPCSAAALSGLLADHLSIGTEYARALDAVLGDRSQALVLNDESNVHDIASWLTTKAGGQAALTVRGGQAMGPVRPLSIPIGLEKGVVGTLRDQVRCEDDFARVADVLCDDVILVKDLETAFEIIRGEPRLRCVTPAGELVDGAGLVAGERTLAQGAIGRRSSAAELQAEITELEERRTRVNAEIASAREARQGMQARLDEAEATVERARERLAEAQGNLGTARARARDLGAQTEALQREHDGVVAEATQLVADLERARLRFKELDESYARESGVLREMESRGGELESQRDELNQAEGQSRVELTRIEEQIDGLESRVRDLRRGIESSTSEVQRAQRLSEEADENAKTGSAESEQLAENSATIAEERERVSSKMAQLRARTSEADQELDRVRREQDALTRSLEGRASELSNLRLDEQRIALARDEVSRRAVEELELELDGLLESFEPEEELSSKEAIGALDKEVRDLKSKLDRMGPVNTEALSELEEVGGRLEFLDGQVGDLNQSRKVLNETLKKIEEESERLFVITFDEVRKNFQRLFRQLFGGGKADVKLAEGEPVLEAGVEISARPPGREMLPIGLLSGGQRTMTALALLFAVFEARPSPFCVLDEVDAALDDANIQRFLVMLDNFRKSTQFIVVTHNKGTMARCEGLYGVTMQTKGVSRHVSVQLEEVDEFIPEATGGGAASQAATPKEPQARSAGGDDLDAESGEPIVEIVPRGVGEAATEEEAVVATEETTQAGS